MASLREAVIRDDDGVNHDPADRHRIRAGKRDVQIRRRRQRDRASVLVFV